MTLDLTPWTLYRGATSEADDDSSLCFLTDTFYVGQACYSTLPELFHLIYTLSHLRQLSDVDILLTPTFDR